MARLAYDIETNSIAFDDPANWLKSAKEIHCLVLGDIDTGEVVAYNDQGNGAPSIEEGINKLMAAEQRYAHNGAQFDEPVIEALRGVRLPRRRLVDTRALSEARYGDGVRGMDIAAERKYAGKWIPKHLYGSHSLEAWGERLGDFKDDYKARCKAGEYGPEFTTDPFCRWHQPLEDYCVQDVKVTMRLVERFASELAKPYAWIEAEVYRIVRRMEAFGFPFDVKAAERLYTDLVARRQEIATELRERFFGPFYRPNGVTSPARSMKRTNKVTGLKEDITEGCDYTKVQVVEFNPGSRDHIALRLQAQYKWRPKEFTPEGKPKVDEAVMAGLTFPPCELLREYLVVSKIAGYIGEGNEAWLKREVNGRLHCRYRVNGTRTGRMSCTRPNLQQVPSGRTPLGEACRKLFRPPPGMKQLGWDAEGLELRKLAHYMSYHDGGSYGRTVCEGRKEDESDVHNVNKRAVGLNSRDSAKTVAYALIYGAGDFKLGSIVYDDMTPKQRKAFGRPSRRNLAKLGKERRERLMTALPALARVTEKVQAAAKKRGWLRGLDGRRMRDASAHNGLNTLLQGGGGQVMKLAFVLLDEALQDDLMLVPGEGYEFMAMVHDEAQMAVSPEWADIVGREAQKALAAAGEMLGVRVPLEAGFQIGDSWHDTH